MRKGEASKYGEDYNTDENEENLNDLMLKMRKEVPQIYLKKKSGITSNEDCAMRLQQKIHVKRNAQNCDQKLCTKRRI